MSDIYGFSEQAKKVLDLAEAECRSFQQDAIRTEHLLLGLISEGEGVTAQVFAHFGLELNNVRAQIEWIIGLGDYPATLPVKWTPRARTILNFAASEALRLRQSLIGTEHLLLSLLHDETSRGAGVLESLGVNLEQVRLYTLQRVKRRK